MARPIEPAFYYNLHEAMDGSCFRRYDLGCSESAGTPQGIFSKNGESMKEKKAEPDQSNGLGRREFGQRAALALTGAALASTPIAGLTHDFVADPMSASFEQDQNESGLSAHAQAEVESKLNHILATYGSRLTDDQKKRMRRIISEHVRMLEVVRPISVGNGDAPATVLKLVERKTQQSAETGTSARSSKSRGDAAKSSKRGE